MQVVATELPGVLILEPKVFEDDRGFFMESFNARTFAELTGCADAMVQDNHSRSAFGVLRGLHYQLPPMAQGKLVRVLIGEIFDVAVDVRRGSPYFGVWTGVHLSEASRRQLWIPPGFAHGFYTLSPVADVVYKTTEYYSPAHDRGICWNDRNIGIRWPLGSNELPIISSKDASAPNLNQAEVFA